jgi:hypothetical protein
MQFPFVGSQGYKEDLIETTWEEQNGGERFLSCTSGRHHMHHLITSQVAMQEYEARSLLVYCDWGWRTRSSTNSKKDYKSLKK